jgi:MFS family permease
VIALGIFGIGNSIVDVAAFTLLQRTVPNEVLGRVFGALEGILFGAITVGTIAAPGLIDLLGARTSIIAVGAVLPALTLLTWPRLRRIDTTAMAPATVELLRGVEIFTTLPPATLERLARSLTEVNVPAGTTIIRKGEAGDRFYVVEDGLAEIEGNTFGPGSSFGEIALLRDVPRTATVTAQTDVILQALERDEFLPAVTASEPSRAVAEALISRRLGELGGG